MTTTARRLNFVLVALFALGPFLLVLILLCGCAGPGFGSAAFQITTNYVPQVHVVERAVTNFVPVTNVVRELVPVPGTTTTNVIEHTNVVILQTVVTNYATITNQVPVSVEVKPREGLTTAIGVGGSLGGPWGTFGAVLATAVLGILARQRERKINADLKGDLEAHYDAGVALTEGIEVARELLKKTPQGQATEAAYLNWLKGHQGAAGVIGTVTEIVEKHVDNDVAKAAANLIKPPAQS